MYLKIELPEIPERLSEEWERTKGFGESGQSKQPQLGKQRGKADMVGLRLGVRSSTLNMGSSRIL